MPTDDGDKVVLVIRVAADRAPRPILHKGSVLVRLDGRNATADRRVARALFRQDLIDAGDWHGAVTDALTVIAMDWKFLNPLIS